MKSRDARVIGGVVLLAWALASGCDAPSSEGALPTIAVSSSYLECAARDVLGGEAAMLRLAEPGMCPGHFDIRPGQVRELRGCRVLLRFDFQRSLDQEVEGTGCVAVAVSMAGGMCEPESYLSACRQVAEGLERASLLDGATSRTRLAGIRARVEGMSGAMRARIEEAGLKDAAVITSSHQAGFCRWLGLRVVAAIGGADTASVGQVDRALVLGRQANCRLVIANRPEGAQLAESIADRLGAKLVVFDNFPAMTASQRDFGGLVGANVDRLIAAGGR